MQEILIAFLFLKERKQRADSLKSGLVLRIVLTLNPIFFRLQDTCMA